MATRGRIQSGTQPQRTHVDAGVGRQREGSFEVTEWPVLGCCVARHAIKLHHSDSSPPLSCPAAAQAPPSPPSDCSHLPMWPPTRFLWPSSCSVLLGLLARRGFAMQNAVARVCRETGARVSTNVMVRDLDLLAPQALDGRRLEVVAEGLPLFGSMQLAIDALSTARAGAVWQCRSLAVGKSALILNSSDPAQGRDWSFWLAKWEAGCLVKRARLFGCWQKRRPVLNPILRVATSTVASRLRWWPLLLEEVCFAC